MKDPLFKPSDSPLTAEEEAGITKKLADAYSEQEAAESKPALQRILSLVAEKLASEFRDVSSIHREDKDYSSEFTESSFWQKATNVAKTAGRELIEKALIMYYATIDSDTPVWAKTILVGALGYFICPIDAIPDAIPVGGYTDDLGAIVAALGMVAAHIKPEHKEAAKKKADEWFS
jgi:uncharacterized membrane protein YkvA (DUF1232 family)